MGSKSEWWAMECADCSFRTEYCAPEAELAELYRSWPHVAALRGTTVLQVEIDNSSLSGFMEVHGSHSLRMVGESGESRELSRGDNSENERLWRAIYFAAGMIDEYQKAIGRRPDLLEEGFCQSDLFRNALRALRMIAQGQDGEASAKQSDGTD